MEVISLMQVKGDEDIGVKVRVRVQKSKVRWIPRHKIYSTKFAVF